MATEDAAARIRPRLTARSPSKNPSRLKSSLPPDLLWKMSGKRPKQKSGAMGGFRLEDIDWCFTAEGCGKALAGRFATGGQNRPAEDEPMIPKSKRHANCALPRDGECIRRRTSRAQARRHCGQAHDPRELSSTEDRCIDQVNHRIHSGLGDTPAVGKYGGITRRSEQLGYRLAYGPLTGGPHTIRETSLGARVRGWSAPVVLATALQTSGRARLTSVDHDPTFTQAVWAQVSRCGISSMPT